MRRWIVTFSIVQLVGIASSWFSEHPYSAASSFLWGCGVVRLCFPEICWAPGLYRACSGKGISRWEP